MPRNEGVEVVRNFLGLDLQEDATAIAPNRFRKLENYQPFRGSGRVLGKRLGSAKYNASAISSASGIDNGLRAWLADGTKKLVVAATVATNDVLAVGDDALGTFTAITGGSALPTGAVWSFVNWPLLGEAYALSGDGTCPIQILGTSFTTKADMAIGAGATDARFGKFGAIFFARLVTARTPTNPAYVYYFNVANSGTIGATQFWRHREPVTGLGKNTFGTTTDSLNEVLIVFGANTMGYVPGDPSSAVLQQGPHIGCLSPKTIVDTPIGLMFLGSDWNVYLVGADPRFPKKVGTRIYPRLSTVLRTQLPDACAVYHDGFYKLSVAAGGGTTNTEQYWGDVLSVVDGATDEIEWYGPATNLALRCFILFDAPADALELRGGSDTVGTIWKLAQSESYVDGSDTIVGKIHTKEFNEDDPLRDKIWNGFTFGYLKSATGSLSLDIVRDSGRAFTSETLSWTQSGALWDDAQWDEDLWAGEEYVEEAVNPDERLVGKTVQLQMTHSTASDWRIRDFGRKAKTIRRML